MPDYSIMPAVDGPRFRAKDVTRKVLLNRAAHATTLLVLFLDLYGEDKDDEGHIACLQWHPRVVKQELEDDFDVILPGGNLDRIMAGICILTTNLFFRNAGAFAHLANVLAGDDFDPDEFDPPDAAECAWAITEALLLDPPDGESPEPFSQEVRRFLGQVLKNEGYVRAPDVLRVALDADWSAQVGHDWGDDADTMKEVQRTQDMKKKEIEEVVRDGLVELAAQLAALPLANGSTRAFVKKIGELVHRQE